MGSLLVASAGGGVCMRTRWVNIFQLNRKSVRQRHFCSRSRVTLVNCLRQTHAFEKPDGLQPHSVAFSDGTRSESTTEPKSQRGIRRAYYFDFCLFNTPGSVHRFSLWLDPVCATSVSLWLTDTVRRNTWRFCWKLDMG
jgi:hypothetical protein